jgi:hypothetical protein
MSFAQGLLAGTQAARNVMDSYKEARDARVKREFAQGLAAIDEQGAGPKQFTPDMMPEAAPDPNAPTNMAGLANTPQMTAPTMPLSPQQRLQQQIALANRLGLGQEAANFTNQLTSLNQREEDMRYRAQRDTMSDIDRERERQDRLEQTSIDRNLRAANDALQYQLAQERQGIAQSAEDRAAAAAAAADERISFSDIGASAANAVAMGRQLSPEQLEAMRENSVAANSFYKTLEDKGISTTQLGNLTNTFTSGLNSLLDSLDSYSEEDALAAATNFAQQLDPNAENNSPVRFIKQEDGSYLVEEGGIKLAEGSIRDILSKFKNDLDSNPEGYGVQLYVLNQQQAKAAQNRFSQQLAASKANAEQTKLAIEYIKANTQNGMGPRPGTPEYAALEASALRFAGVTGGLQQTPPLNASVLDQTGGNELTTGSQDVTPPEPTIVEQVTGGLQSQAQKQREAREAASRAAKEARMQPGGDLFNREVSKVTRDLNSKLRQLATEDMPSAIENITAQLEDGENLSPIERAALEKSREYISQIYANRTK